MAEAALGARPGPSQAQLLAPSTCTPLGSGHCRAGAENARADVPRRPEILRPHPGEEHPRRARTRWKRSGRCCAARGRRRAPGQILAAELDLAARMAVQSCRIMLWQQALAGGRTALARRLAKAGIADLRDLDHDFRGGLAVAQQRHDARTARPSCAGASRITAEASCTFRRKSRAGRNRASTTRANGILCLLPIYEENTT